MHIFEEIRNGNISLQKSEENQNKFKSNLNKIASGNPKHKEKYQLERIRNLYDSRQKVIDLFNDYAKVRSEAIYETKKGTGLKILTPRQIFQRLPIVLAQVKVGNNSKILLNEIRQISYSLYQSK